MAEDNIFTNTSTPEEEVKPLGAGNTNKKATTKNQHFVPQFYQRNFSADKKTIGTYIIGQKRYIPTAGIKHQSSADYIYSANMKIEEALGSLEALASKAIEKVITYPTCMLDGEDAMALYVFTMLQIGRTPAFIKMMMDNANKMGTLMLRKYVEAMRKTAHSDEVGLITDEVLDAVSIEMKEPGLHAVGAISKLIDTCYDLLVDAKILINMTGKGFISSDNPACLYDQHFERVGGLNYALGSCGLQIYLPLAPNMAIMYYDRECYKLGDRKKHYVELTQDKDVEQLNRLVACTADEVLYCKNGTVNISDLERYTKAHNAFHVSDPVRTFEACKTEKSEIIGAQQQSMFCKLNLSFVKELPYYKARDFSIYRLNLNRMRKSVQYLDKYRR